MPGRQDCLDADFSEYLALKCDLSLDSHFQRGMRRPTVHRSGTTKPSGLESLRYQITHASDELMINSLTHTYTHINIYTAAFELYKSK